MTTYVESTITFPYRRSLGPVIGRFMTGLTEMRVVGIRSGGRVIVPRSSGIRRPVRSWPTNSSMWAGRGR